MDAVSSATATIVNNITEVISFGDVEEDKKLAEAVTKVVRTGLSELSSKLKASPAPVALIKPVIVPIHGAVVKHVTGYNLFTHEMCESLGKDEVKKRGGMTGKSIENPAKSWLSVEWEKLSEPARADFNSRAKAMSAGAPPRKSSPTGSNPWTVFTQLWSAKCKELKVAYNMDAVKSAYPQFKAMAEADRPSFFNTFQIASPMQA